MLQRWSTRCGAVWQSYGRDLMGDGIVGSLHELVRAMAAMAARFSARREREKGGVK
jgi:hypothetical protein